jgi:predicted NodU family carbamoyl transferase
MTTVAPVLPEARERLAAVTHVDGTARLQLVAEDTFLGQVIARVGRATGTAAVLNTSLNGRGEPIVATEADALAFLLAHPVDALLIDDTVVHG